MSYDDVDDQYDDEPQQTEPNWRRKLEKKAQKFEQENADLQRQLSQLQRENAFAKAGVPLSDKKAAYFVKGYDGDLDPEAIRKEAIEFGLIAGSKDEEPEVPVEEQQAHQRMQALATADPAGPGADFHAQLAATRALSREEGKAAVLRLAAQQGLPVATVQ